MDFLIIEDEPVILKGISFLIKEYNYPNNEIPRIQIAQDGEEANQRLKTESFDFIFTDIKMPKMSGIELVEKWSPNTSDTQWVVISGFNYFEYAQKAIKHGVKDYLLKPVTKKKMNSVLERLLENRKKTINSFVTITQSKNIIDELEESIWVLDKEEVIQQFNSWTNKIPYDSIDRLNYQKSLEEILYFLTDRFRAKGIKDIHTENFRITGHTKDELGQIFLEKCTEMIKIIQLKRKGNVIDPIEAAKEYIQTHVNEKIQLSDVADRLGFNSTYFSQLFKKETGESFVSFRRKTRMELAKRLLEEDAMKIIDIANSIGYGDLAHFTKSFKKYTGFTPSEYKQQLGIFL